MGSLFGSGSLFNPSVSGTPTLNPPQLTGGLFGAIMGQKATSPSSNLSSPSNTLPQNQVANTGQANASTPTGNVNFSYPNAQGQQTMTPVGPQTVPGSTTGQGAIGTIGTAAGKIAPPPGYGYNALGQLTQGGTLTGAPYVAPQTNAQTNTGNTQTGQNGIGNSTGVSDTNGQSTSYTPSTSYGTYSSALANTPAQTQPVTSGLVQSLQNSYQNNPQVKYYTDQIAQLQSQYGNTNAQIQGTPGLGQQEVQGEQGLLNQNYATQLGAAQSGLANALQGLTLQQAGSTQAGNLATTEQGLTQSALQGATTATAPVTQYGALTSPTTGQPISGSSVISSASSLPAAAQSALALLPQTAQNAVMLEAQKLQNNQETQQEALNNLSSYGQTGVTALNAILGSNFNANTNAGASSAQSSNVATGGTASVTANQNVYNTAMSNLANYTNMANNIQSFGNQALQNISSLGLTPSQSINAAMQTAATQLNNPAYAQFNTNIQGLQARVSALLSTGEIPTSATAGAQSIVNGDLNIGSLQSTLDQINAEASAIVSNQAGIASDAYNNIQSGAQTNTSSGSSSTSFTKGQTAAGGAITWNGTQWVATQ